MRFLVVFLSGALLLGCSSTAVRLTGDERQLAWQNHLSQLNSSHHWSLRGRLALQTDDKGWQVNLSWRKSEQEQSIQLTGPFGGGVVSLTQNQDGAVLKDNRGNEYRDSDTEGLLQRVTGWRLPVTGLQFWVRGQVIPDKAADLELDGFGRLKRLRQDDWDIRYLAYARYGELHLPRRIFMSRAVHDGSGRKLEIRLGLNSWQSVP